MKHSENGGGVLWGVQPTYLVVRGMGDQKDSHHSPYFDPYACGTWKFAEVSVLGALPEGCNKWYGDSALAREENAWLARGWSHSNSSMLFGTKKTPVASRTCLYDKFIEATCRRVAHTELVVRAAPHVLQRWATGQ